MSCLWVGLRSGSLITVLFLAPVANANDRGVTQPPDHSVASGLVDTYLNSETKNYAERARAAKRILSLRGLCRGNFIARLDHIVRTASEENSKGWSIDVLESVLKECLESQESEEGQETALPDVIFGHFTRYIKSENYTTRNSAAFAMARLSRKDKRAIQILVESVVPESGRLDSSIRALGKLSPKRSLPVYAEIIEDSRYTESEKSQASFQVMLLSQREQVITLYGDEIFRMAERYSAAGHATRVRSRFLGALSEFGETEYSQRAKDLIQLASMDEDREVRLSAFEAAEKIQAHFPELANSIVRIEQADDEAVSLFGTWFDPDKRVRQAAVNTLAGVVLRDWALVDNRREYFQALINYAQEGHEDHSFWKTIEYRTRLIFSIHVLSYSTVENPVPEKLAFLKIDVTRKNFKNVSGMVLFFGLLEALVTMGGSLLDPNSLIYYAHNYLPYDMEPIESLSEELQVALESYVETLAI